MFRYDDYHIVFDSFPCFKSCSVPRHHRCPSPKVRSAAHIFAPRAVHFQFWRGTGKRTVSRHLPEDEEVFERRFSTSDRRRVKVPPFALTAISSPARKSGSGWSGTSWGSREWL